jgi:RNA polymerase sigma-70 factor, ECF subfamily
MKPDLSAGSGVDFEGIFRRYYPALHRYLLRLTGDADMADDIAQDAFMRLLERPLPEAEARPWLFTVATNRLRDHARSNARRKRLLEANPPERTATPPMGEELARDREMQRVRRALDALTDRDREILLMREEGFKYAEIAEVIGVAPSSVGTLAARALRRFSKQFRSQENLK